MEHLSLPLTDLPKYNFFKHTNNTKQILYINAAFLMFNPIIYTLCKKNRPLILLL